MRNYIIRYNLSHFPIVKYLEKKENIKIINSRLK